VKISKNWETPGQIGWMISDDSSNCYLKLSKKHGLHNFLSSESRWKKLSSLEQVGQVFMNYIPNKGIYNGKDALLQLRAEMNRPVIKTFNPKIIRRSGNAI
jgi:hypothetical protein